MNSMDARVYAQEYDIRDCLKGMYPKARFSVPGLEARNYAMRQILRKAGLTAAARRSAISNDFNDLSPTGRRSAVCAFEQFRARLWILSAVRRHFFDQGNLHFVTLADERHRVPAEDLSAFRPQQAHYAFKNALAKLARSAPELRALGMVEVSVSRVGDEMFFEPHIHAVVAGVTRKQLKFALPGLPNYNRRVNTIHTLMPCGFYLSKFKPELRSDYLGSDGKVRHRRNKMAPGEHAAWAAWGAHLGIADLLFVRGFSNDFETADFANLLDALVGPYKKIPQPKLPSARIQHQKPIRGCEL